jgi:hypothetical protein
MVDPPVQYLGPAYLDRSTWKGRTMTTQLDSRTGSGIPRPLPVEGPDDDARASERAAVTDGRSRVADRRRWPDRPQTQATPAPIKTIPAGAQYDQYTRLQGSTPGQPQTLRPPSHERVRGYTRTRCRAVLRARRMRPASIDHHRDNEQERFRHPDRLGFPPRSWTGWAAVASATSQAGRAVIRPAGTAALVVALLGVVLLLPGAAVAGSRWWVQTTQSVAHATHTQLLGVSCASERSCAAVGYSTGGGGGFVPLVERRHADRWSVESVQTPRGARSGVPSAIATIAPRSATSRTRPASR